MSRYVKHFNTKDTPQTEKVPFSNQVPNSAGGFVFEVNDWVKLDRFLILGTEGGSYYAGEREMTLQKSEIIVNLIKEHGLRLVRRVVEISQAGRAPKNDPAIFMLAMASKLGSEKTRQAAHKAVPLVCRTGTHLFQFAEAMQTFGGWGRGTRTAVGEWYTGKNPDSLAYQLVKYRQRSGWSHGDLLRLTHVKLPQAIANFALDKPVLDGVIPNLIAGFQQMQLAKSEKDVTRTLAAYPALPWETIPSQFLKSKDVWAALLPNMKLTAMVRNLARMTSNGLIAPMSSAIRMIEDKLADFEQLKKERVHPIQLLSAACTYGQGKGEKGSLTWKPEPRIVDALDMAFHAAFGVLEPSNKRTLLALDISGSMGTGTIAGIPGLSPRVGSAAMVMVTARTERDYHFMGFGGRFHPLNITARQSLSTVVKTISGLPFETTDCSLPMKYAAQHKIPVDTFCVYTDNETYAGRPHPHQALQDYRQKMGIGAKLVVVGMVGNDFTIADPKDSGMMDVIGFDTATPNLIADFSR